MIDQLVFVDKVVFIVLFEGGKQFALLGDVGAVVVNEVVF